MSCEINWSKRRVWSSEHIRAEQRELDLGDWGNEREVETRKAVML